MSNQKGIHKAFQRKKLIEGARLVFQSQLIEALFAELLLQFMLAVLAEKTSYVEGSQIIMSYRRVLFVLTFRISTIVW